MLKDLYHHLNPNHRDFDAVLLLIEKDPAAVRKALKQEEEDARPSDTVLGLSVSCPRLVEWLLENDAKIITKENTAGCWSSLLIIPTVTAERSWEFKNRDNIDRSLKILCNHSRMPNHDKELALEYLTSKISQIQNIPGHDQYKALLQQHKQIIEESLQLESTLKM